MRKTASRVTSQTQRDFLLDALARFGATIGDGTRCRLWQVSWNRQTGSGERSKRRARVFNFAATTPRLCSLRSVPRHAVHARILYPPLVSPLIPEYPLFHLLDSCLISLRFQHAHYFSDERATGWLLSWTRIYVAARAKVSCGVAPDPDACIDAYRDRSVLLVNDRPASTPHESAQE